jgi:hypothetical protein
MRLWMTTGKKGCYRWDFLCVLQVLVEFVRTYHVALTRLQIHVVVPTSAPLVDKSETSITDVASVSNPMSRIVPLLPLVINVRLWTRCAEPREFPLAWLFPAVGKPKFDQFLHMKILPCHPVKFDIAVLWLPSVPPLNIKV